MLVDGEGYRRLQAILRREAGIVLGDERQALVEARLGRRARELGFSTLASYLDSAPRGTSEMNRVVDAMSTNFTSFFREAAHFDFLERRIAKWEREGRRTVLMWSAACSTGQEPYSMAMTALPFVRRGMQVRILATDLSSRVLQVARRGEYADTSAAREGLLEPIEGGRMRVSADVRRLVSFARLNLASPRLPMRGPFDVVFCCNVLIYLSEEVQRGLMTHLNRLLADDGFLAISAAESVPPDAPFGRRAAGLLEKAKR